MNLLDYSAIDFTIRYALSSHVLGAHQKSPLTPSTENIPVIKNSTVAHNTLTASQTCLPSSNFRASNLKQIQLFSTKSLFVPLEVKAAGGALHLSKGNDYKMIETNPKGHTPHGASGPATGQDLRYGRSVGAYVYTSYECR
jgi:hypothetical protein